MKTWAGNTDSTGNEITTKYEAESDKTESIPYTWIKNGEIETGRKKVEPFYFWMIGRMEESGGF